MAAATSSASVITSSSQTLFAAPSSVSTNNLSTTYANSFTGTRFPGYLPKKRRSIKIDGKITAAAATSTVPVAANPAKEFKEYATPLTNELASMNSPFKYIYKKKVYWKFYPRNSSPVLFAVFNSF